MFGQFSQLLVTVRFSEEGGNFLDFSTQILLLGSIRIHIFSVIWGEGIN